MTSRDDGRAAADSPIQAIVAYDDDYVQPLIVAALEALFPQNTLRVETKLRSLDASDARVLQITAYESIDFEYAASHPQSCLVNSYVIRKALIRKHFLSVTVDHWVAKHPTSVLGRHVKRSEAFELDYAEFLDDALVEAFDLRDSLDRNAGLADAAARQWWILKPGMSDRGQGIRLFSTMEELQAIFDGWEEDCPDSDDDAGESEALETGDYMTTSHLRHFVAQPYIHRPLLLDSDARKFHIRTYVLCTSSLAVHVYKPMLALFAAKPYRAPWAHAATDADTFLTNTCLQAPSSAAADANSVRRFWDLPLAQATLDDIFAQVCNVAGEAFEAAATAMPVHFQPRPNAFEVFGLDFLVDEARVAWLLEVNAFPDFKQTGPELGDVVAGFWKDVVHEAVLPFFGVEGGADGGGEAMVCVKRIDLGRR